MPETSLNGKVALVTGGSRGVGKHTAAALTRAGATVAITGRDSNTLRAAAEQIGHDCRFYVCDQSDASAVREMAKAVTAEIGTLDILVNNAAVMKFAPVETCSLELWSEVIATNLTGVFVTTQAFLSGMLQKGQADIFIISSMSGKKGDPGSGAYSASKFGLQGFAQSLMYEVRRSNIRVMTLNPSKIETGEDNGPKGGAGVYLHAADLAETIVHLATLPGRTLVRDLDVWGTNPFQ